MRNLKTVNYDEMFTLSAPSPKWVWNAQGQLVEIPAGQPAWDHDPVTGEPLGQRLEGEATNYVGHSEDFSQWAGAGDFYSITNNIGGAPDGGDYQTITKPGAAGVLTYEFVPPAGPGIIKLRYKNPQNFSGTWSFLLRNRDTATSLSFFLNIHPNGDTSGPAYVEKIGEWNVATFFYDGSGHSAGDRLIVYANSGAGSGEGASLDLWGYEYKPGATDSSYIRTTDGSAVTRAADVATIENVDAAKWFGKEAGWFGLRVTPYQNETQDGYLYASSNQRLLYNSNGRLRMWDGENATPGGPVPTPNVELIICGTWSSGASTMKLASSDTVVIQKSSYNGIFSSIQSIPLMRNEPSRTTGSVVYDLRFGKRFLSDAEMQSKIQELTS
jgi:hypothetical protein